MGYTLCPPGPWGKTYCRNTRKWMSHCKGTKQRRPQFLREAAGKPVSPHRGDIHSAHLEQVFLAQTNPLLQLAGGCNDSRQRKQVVNDHGVCVTPCLSAAKIACCVVDWWVWHFHCLQKNKKGSAPVCFSSISYYLPFRTCSAVQGTVVYVKSMKGITRQTQQNALSLFQCLLCFAGSVGLSSRKHNCNSGRVSIIFLFAGNKKKPQADIFLKKNPKGYILHTTETRKKKRRRE